MTSIYDQHDKAFEHVSAYVIAHKGERVATIAFKFPRDGAGRLWAYVHWTGDEMVRGYAGGFGYDKRSAACSSAAGRSDFRRYGATPGSAREKFYSAIIRDDGCTWDARLRDAGFAVWQAV